jgi:hypothetical protein
LQAFPPHIIILLLLTTFFKNVLFLKMIIARSGMVFLCRADDLKCSNNVMGQQYIWAGRTVCLISNSRILVVVGAKLDVSVAEGGLLAWAPGAVGGS